MTKPSALVILSGGQDSTTCLWWAKMHHDRIHTLTFNYGQRHSREIESAKIIASMAQVEKHTILTMGNILSGDSPLTTAADLEQYQDWQSLPGGLEKTFVPGRNAVFLALASSYAYANKLDKIVVGISQEDFGGYPDCRQQFLTQMERAMQAALDWEQLEFVAPLLFLNKAMTCLMGATMPGCSEALAFSHTAYDGKYPPTGHDHASLLRAKGYEQAKLPDPLVVRAWREGVMDLPFTANYDELASRVPPPQGDPLAGVDPLATAGDAGGLDAPTVQHAVNCPYPGKACNCGAIPPSV